MFVLQITASCALEWSKQCCLTLYVRSLFCPTLCFDVVFPINSILYVCMLFFHCLVLLAVFLWLLMVCDVMLCHWSNCSCTLIVFFFSFFPLRSWFFRFLILRSLLVIAVFLFVEVSFCKTGAIYCGISCNHEYLVCGCGGLLCHSCNVG